MYVWNINQDDVRQTSRTKLSGLSATRNRPLVPFASRKFCNRQESEQCLQSIDTLASNLVFLSISLKFEFAQSRARALLFIRKEARLLTLCALQLRSRHRSWNNVPKSSSTTILHLVLSYNLGSFEAEKFKVGNSAKNDTATILGRSTWIVSIVVITQYCL